MCVPWVLGPLRSPVIGLGPRSPGQSLDPLFRPSHVEAIDEGMVVDMYSTEMEVETEKWKW